MSVNPHELSAYLRMEWNFHVILGACPTPPIVYYQVLGEPGIAGCNTVAVRSSCGSDIYLMRCGYTRMFFG